MTRRVVVHLHGDRRLSGTIVLCVDGAVWDLGECIGKADNRRALRAGNDLRKPTLPYGDTPVGTYRVTRIERIPELAHTQRHSYGPAFIALDPVDGDALIAERNGRSGIGIHGGALRNEALRPTYGCVRTRDAFIAGIIEAGIKSGDEVVVMEAGDE